MKQNFTLFTCILCFLEIFLLIAAAIASKSNQQMIYTQNVEILNSQNKILTEIIELSKKYPVYEINLSKQPKTKIKKIKDLEKEIQKLLKGE